MAALAECIRNYFQTKITGSYRLIFNFESSHICYTIDMKIEPGHFVVIVLLVVFGVFVAYSSKNNYGVSAPAVQQAPLPAVVEKDTPDVTLQNGDTYDLAAGYVANMVGGKMQTMLAYNGSIPGPTIHVMQGSEITINFKNNTDLPALLHSHGVRMDNAYDGSQLVQDELKPGESFSYKLKFPDAGIYWYHPHAKEVYGQGLGLYGAFVVTPKDPKYFPLVNREVPLFLSDVPMTNGVITLRKDVADFSLMGHYGNVMLINGKDAYTLDAKEGETVRLYVINAANVRPFNFAIEGVKLKLVGSDSGAYEKETFVDSVILAPSERAIVDVLMPKAGVYSISNKTPVGTYALGTVSVSGEQTKDSYKDEYGTLENSEVTTKSIAKFQNVIDSEPTKRISLSIDMKGNMMGMGHSGGGMMGGGMMSGVSPDGIEWNDGHQQMNMMSSTDSITWKIVDIDTGKENMDVDWVFKKDVPVKIRIFNDPNSMHPMQHPIHFHGQRFLVVDRNGVKQTNLAWKDTVLVRSGETVDIVLDPSNPGTWMAHCHISEHLEAGMMIPFTVK